MKKIGKNYIWVLLLLFCSCNSFLNVDLVDQVEEEKLFSSEQGFKEALAGVYSRISKNDMYGREMSFGTLDVLAQEYEYSSIGTAYKVFRDYKYTDQTVKNRFSSFWNNSYAAIASVNNILRWVDKNGGVMRPDVRNRVVGEAYALRAFLHFDVFRMFAPDVRRNGAAKVVPYNWEFGVNTPFVYSGDDFVGLVLEDLNRALVAFEDDPIRNVVPYQLWDQGTSAQEGGKNKNGADQYVARMNYFAVNALMARVYLAKGDLKNAREKAQEVIDSEKFRLVDSKSSLEMSNSEMVDLLFSDEHIFSLRNAKVQDYSKDVHINTDGLTGQPLLTVSSSYNGLYGDQNDVRLWKWFNGEVSRLVKYNPSSAVYFVPKVPLIKLSEMYLIAAEGWLAEDLGKAQDLLQALCDSRHRESEVADAVSEDALLREMRREFIGEGQLFFAYKRLNRDIQVDTGEGNVAASDAVFVFPIPDNEIENGNREVK